MTPSKRNRRLSEASVRELRRNAATRKAVVRIRRALLEIQRTTPTIAQDARRLGVNQTYAKRIAAGMVYKHVQMPGPSVRISQVW